ncbi:hypothetical protein KIN20_026523 [Parelaphostrongylus tenuis]|uniref:Uncharacterized protein n=1 Tax=Parelaphostrongylus tenuis TaxID=148309 RepID=A0AAD5QY43_PARTN|nr:hypothetical protein KIN20_026523 [Parelaphostrongylus tenuis]
MNASIAANVMHRAKSVFVSSKGNTEGAWLSIGSFETQWRTNSKPAVLSRTTYASVTIPQMKTDTDFKLIEALMIMELSKNVVIMSISVDSQMSHLQ